MTWSGRLALAFYLLSVALLLSFFIKVFFLYEDPCINICKPGLPDSRSAYNVCACNMNIEYREIKR